MKRVVEVFVLPLLIAGMAVAQGSKSYGTPPSTPPQTPPATTPSQPPAQQPAPAAPAPTAANPKGKKMPSAKTKQEYDAFTAAANKPDAASAEAAAREFEVQFPNSELLPLLFQQVLNKYQKADNGDKALDMGRKVLQYDPDNVFALVMNATVLAERTRESDIDRDTRVNEAVTDAQRALENLRTGNYLLNASATPEQIQQFKDQVSSMAYTALGTAEMVRKNDAAAEQNFRKVLEIPGAKGDAIVWYRLVLALDHQEKYAEANNTINMAVALAPANSSVAGQAKAEQSRLKQLTGAGSSTATAAPKNANQPEPIAVQPNR